MNTKIKLLISVIAASGVLLGGTHPASALARCRGAACNGRDPRAMGCAADAVTTAISPNPGTAAAGWQEVVELRFSRRCQTRWSRVTSRLAAAAVKSNTAYLSGHPSTRVTKGAVAVVWSRMWTAGSACGNTISVSDPSYHPTHCVP